MKAPYIMVGGLVVIGIIVAVYSKNQFVQPPPTIPNETLETTSTFVKQDTSSSTETSPYVSYSKELFDQSEDKKRVYFFHASWCPTCRAADSTFTQNREKIPSDVMLFKTDYDAETELKKQYSITYQHTFVHVDSNGKEIKKWNGGDIEELLKNTQ